MQPRWLKLKDAIEYSAIGRHRLQKLAAAGEIVGFQDTDRGDWIFDRKSIDDFRQNQAGQIELKVARLTGGIV